MTDCRDYRHRLFGPSEPRMYELYLSRLTQVHILTDAFQVLKACVFLSLEIFSKGWRVDEWRVKLIANEPNPLFTCMKV